jgi:hypothetical protein
MTDLLTSARSRPTTPAPRTGGGRPLWLGAGAAGVVAASSVLLTCMAIGLVGWFASDAGAHGDTRDAIRVGADAWLLAHGSTLELAGATITAVPLGLTALCLYVSHRLGRWAGLTSAPEDRAGTGLAVVVLAGLYGVVALLTALLASTDAAETGLGRAFVGGVVVGLIGGGSGLAATSASVRAARDRLPATVRAVATGTLAVVLLMLAAGSALVVTALLLDLGEAANVLSRLHPDAAGAGLYTLVVAGAAPNAALLGGAYLLGPGFAVGAGTLVSPAMVVLGPVPAFPLLAALPPTGPGPAWASALVGLPVLLSGVAAALVVRRHPAAGYETGALRGLASGVLGGAVLTGLVVVAGGSVGPGRMAHVGAPALDTLAAAVVALGAGGLVGGLAATWWVRRHGVPAEPERDPSTEDTVRL